MAKTDKSPIAGEFSGVDLGDPRRNARLHLLVDRVAKQPDGSFPDLMSNDAELEGAYRFFSNVKVEAAEILRPHVRQTVERMAAEPLTLVAHDTSTVSFNSEDREGLTRRGGKQQFLVHCSLAMCADGSRRPLGLVAMSQHLQVTTTDKRLQDRWGQHVLEVHAQGLPPESVVHLMDREGDDYEILDLLKRLQTRFVLRVQHNRLLETGKLRDALADAIVQAQRDVEIAQRHRKGVWAEAK
jgi:hypothetical protein